MSDGNHRILRRRYYQTYYSIFFSNFITLVTISYFEILIGGYLNMGRADESFSSYLTVGLFIVVIVIWLPYTTIKVLIRSKDAFYKDSNTKLPLTAEYHNF